MPEASEGDLNSSREHKELFEWAGCKGRTQNLGSESSPIKLEEE